MSAIVLPVAVSLVALVAEGGQALLVRSENQRIADLASFAGALAISQGAGEAGMRTVAASVAVLNGRTADQVAVSLGVTPRGTGEQAVTATVTSFRSLLLGSMVGVTNQWRLAGVATAQITSNRGACIIALNSAGSGLTLSGGTSIAADNCMISSNATVSAPCGTSIRTPILRYNSASLPNNPCGSIVAPAGSTLSVTRTVTTDPIAGNSTLTAVSARVATVNAMVAPAAPVVGGGGANVDLGWSASGTQGNLKSIGCTGTFSGNTWTVDCPSGGTYNFGALTVGGGINVVFTPNPGITFNFTQSFQHTGGTFTFGDGTFNFVRGLQIGGGATATFGRGVFNFGTMSTGCSGSTVSICHFGGVLRFGGPSRFSIASGIFAGGGSTLEMGSGTSNSYVVGGSSTGNAIETGGAAFVRMADATDAGSLARFTGNVRNGGGSCLLLPSSPNIDVRGSVDVSGGVRIGSSSTMTVTGYVAMGNYGGGNVTCWGATLGVEAQNATLVVGALSTPTAGGCVGFSFCVGQGYSSVTMSAPATGARLLVVGPQNGSTAGAAFIQGASNQRLSGAFYFPTGRVVLDGGASLVNGAGDCLQLIGSEITMSGGASGASACVNSSGGGGGSGGAVALVQ
ncbi:MAG: hypothetical protein K2Y29_20650 [Beijerinckiaceae bacterium]|nr:hypothetical protein [Beijerinckiaceae bacterium]